MTVKPVRAEAVAELMAVLRGAMPYARDAARRHERLGLVEEAAAAWALYHRACWALRAAGQGADGAGGVQHED